MACKALVKNGMFEGRVCGYSDIHEWHELTNSRFDHGYEEGDPTMATKNSTATVDPTLGVPTVPVKTPKTIVTSSAPTPVPTKRGRKARPSGADLKAATEFARKQTGYNDTSPIWNRKQIDVLVDIETLLQEYIDDNGGAAHLSVEAALTLNRELQKRIATNQLIAAQTR